MRENPSRLTNESGPQVEPVMEVRNISKRFPGVLALDDFSLKFYPGEVHAVVGENGAGKSTLMKIMAGAYVPDSGDIHISGKKVTFSHPQEAQKEGVTIIYQEFNLLPDRSVAHNIFLGREPSNSGVINIQKLYAQTEAVLNELGVEKMITPEMMVSTLSVAKQQLVEIAKAISLNARVLIMDEPTAALSFTEVDLLAKLIRKLKEKGLAIIFISHRLAEVFDIADKITVLKDGRFVGTVEKQKVDPAEVVFMMVGRNLDHYFPPLAKPEEIGEVVLRVENASNESLKNLSFELRKGEVLGIAGLQGSGRTELAKAIFGAIPFTSGTVELRGKVIEIKNPSQAIQKRIGFVTEDRKVEGIFPKQPIRDNILLTARSSQLMFGPVFKNGIHKSRNLVPDLGKQVDVRVDSYDREVQYLSGGNQQKVVLAKWLASAADLFIFDEPTRGIDVEAKASIHDMIRELTRRGAAVLMISSELPEIIGMSDRVLVMRDGRIAGNLCAGSSESMIMIMATGGKVENEYSERQKAGKE